MPKINPSIENMTHNMVASLNGTVEKAKIPSKASENNLTKP